MDWSHGRQIIAILASLGFLFLGILAVRDSDKRDILAALSKIQETQATLSANVSTLESLVPASSMLSQTLAEVKARQQMNEHRLDVIEKQLWGK